MYIYGVSRLLVLGSELLDSTTHRHGCVKCSQVNSPNSQPLQAYDGHGGNVTAVGFQKDSKWMFRCAPGTLCRFRVWTGLQRVLSSVCRRAVRTSSSAVSIVFNASFSKAAAVTHCHGGLCVAHFAADVSVTNPDFDPKSHQASSPTVIQPQITMALVLTLSRQP